MKTSNKELASIQLNQAIEQLKEMNEPTLMQAHNDYCQTLGYEDEVFYNDEYEINSNFTSAFDALRNLQNYNLSDDYFYFHNGNLISFSYLTSEQSPVTFSELAQWLINEDKLVDYDITVTTLDDMLASIEDNISDDENILNTVCQYLHLNYVTIDNKHSFDEKVNIVMEIINSFNYEKLDKLITDLNINYK